VNHVIASASEAISVLLVGINSAILGIATSLSLLNDKKERTSLNIYKFVALKS